MIYAMPPAGRAVGDYCEQVKDYSCDTGGWSIFPTGCAKISQESVPISSVSGAAGDGVRIPTVWRYEEINVRLNMGGCGECNQSKGQGPRGHSFCNCVQTNQTLFVPWIIEQDLIFDYQMHMQVPDLDVMAANGVNTPYCEGFLKDPKLEEPPSWTGCQRGDADCLREYYSMSSMPCVVRLRKSDRFQGQNFKETFKFRSPFKDLNSSYFWTDLFGNWRVNVSRILREVTEFTPSHPKPNDDPLKCSFLSTGGSIVLQHFVEPFYPSLWPGSLISNLVCRIGHPSWIQSLFKSSGRKWPCFQVHIEIMYLPHAKWRREEKDIDDMTKGLSKVRSHQHRGIAILAKGGSGTVRRFTWTAFIVGLSSIGQLWQFRLFMIYCIISFVLCGPNSEVYRRALTEKVSTKSMLSAWACRCVAGMWAFEAAERLEDKGKMVDQEGAKLAAKMTRLLESASKNQGKGDREKGDNEREKDQREERRKLGRYVRSILHKGTKGSLGVSLDTPECETLSQPDIDLGQAEKNWLRANEARGPLTSEDVWALFAHSPDVEDFDAVTDPVNVLPKSPGGSLGGPSGVELEEESVEVSVESVGARQVIRGEQGYVRLDARSNSNDSESSEDG
eukprot:Skav224404  [mRNA]  locus=scaffold657:31638:33488:+ [translate_table: standard]